MENRIFWLDIAKGFGIIFVFLGHTIFTNEIWRIWIYSFHMPLFFFLSGIVYNEKKYINIKFLILSKTKTILIPYFILCVVMLISNCITFLYYTIMCGEIANFSFLEKSIGILLSLRGTKWYCGYWFLTCLFLIYILIYFIINFSKSIKFDSKKSILGFSILLLTFGIFYEKSAFPYLPWGIDVAFIATFFSILGWITRVRFKKKMSKVLVLKLATGSLFTSIVNVYLAQEQVDMYSNQYGSFLLFLLSSLLGIFFIIGMSQQLCDKHGIISHIGKNSLYYYGVNVLALKIVDTLTLGVLNGVESENGIIILIKCIIKVILAIGLSRICLSIINDAKNKLLYTWNDSIMHNRRALKK